MIKNKETLLQHPLSYGEFHTKISKYIKPLGRRLRLILHVGTPKTGTTSVQVYLDKKQRKLRNKGVLYPNRSHNPNAPKHQWLEKNLLSCNVDSLTKNFVDILSHVNDDTHTILLSSEGIYNHWWDFSEDAKSLLLELKDLFDMEIWAWFRDPIAFAESFYKQCIRNPQVENIACYGKDLSFAEALEDAWFSQHLDYFGFIDDCENLFGKEAVSVFEYQQDTVKKVSQLLDLATPHDNPTPRKNKSLELSTIEILRVINNYELNAKEKEKLMPLLHELNQALEPYENKNTRQGLVDEGSRKKILEMTASGMQEIHKRYRR